MAAAHQEAALPAYRYIVSNLETNMDDDNCHAVIAYAGLTSAYSLASPRRPDDGRIHNSLDEICEWLRLLKGARRLVRAAGDRLLNGPLAFQLRPARDVDLGYHQNDARLQALEVLFSQERYHSASRDEAADHEAAVYRKTLFALRQSFAVLSAPGENVGVKTSVHWWIETVPQEFLELLGQYEPIALILLAHFAVLLKRGEGCWYMRGGGERILVTVRDSLDDMWIDWIQWPLDTVGV